METIEDLIIEYAELLPLLCTETYIVELYNDISRTDKYKFVSKGIVKKIDGDNS